MLKNSFQHFLPMWDMGKVCGLIYPQHEANIMVFFYLYVARKTLLLFKLEAVKVEQQFLISYFSQKTCFTANICRSKCSKLNWLLLFWLLLIHDTLLSIICDISLIFFCNCCCFYFLLDPFRTMFENHSYLFYLPLLPNLCLDKNEFHIFCWFFFSVIILSDCELW